jgi:hypothetical protein
MDYSHGKIYKLVCNVTGLQYVGSTIGRLCARKSNHLHRYKLWQEGKRSFVTSFKILENGNFDIVLIEEYPCVSKDQLHARERYWIEELTCVNKYVPTRTRKEYKDQHLEHLKACEKEYRERNSDKLKQYQSEWRANNKEALRHSKKAYREANKERIKAHESETWTVVVALQLGEAV